MNKALFIFLIMISPAFADDQNVYDFFRQMEPKSNSAALDEEVTARIKRHMANLLYPVDMTSFARPEKDEKFREQIIALQKQMGVPATGTLTVEQSVRLADAARDIDDRMVGTGIPKTIVKDGDFVSAVGTGGTDDTANPLAQPINISRIFCQRTSGTCELSTAAFDPEEVVPQLYFYTPWDYDITTWEPTRVTATNEMPCATSLMSIDIQTKSVVISSVPHSDLSFCATQGLTSWKLLDDGFPATWKLHQDKVNKARALVYEPERKLVPPVVDASLK
jgi:hypothetical protein